MKKLIINVISESEFTVQGHGVHTAYIELTNALRKRSDIEVVVNKNDIRADIVHIHTVGIYALMRLLFNKGKKVVSAHIIPESLIGSLAGAKHFTLLAKWYLKFFYNRADLILPVSGMVATELQQKMNISPRKIHTLYNSIDMSRYASDPEKKRVARKLLHISESATVVIGNGQVQPRKRVDVLINMAKQMPETQFIWVGGIPFKHLAAEYTSMKKLINTVPKNMTITGVLPLEEVKKYYHAADVFVLPALQENHPMCVLEAAGANLPIVLRDIPEYKDTFNTDALLAKSDADFEAIVRNVLTDKSSYKQAVHGAEAIAKRYDSKAAAEEIIGLYKSLLQ